MFIIKVLAFLWPFLREMILEKKTLGEAIKTNKKKVLLIFIIFASLGLNMFIMPKLVTISEEYLKAEKTNAQDKLKIETLEAKLSACTASPVTVVPVPKPVPDNPVKDAVPVPAAPNPPRKKPSTVPHPSQNDPDARYNDVMEQMRKLQHNEHEGR